MSPKTHEMRVAVVNSGRLPLGCDENVGRKTRCFSRPIENRQHVAGQALPMAKAILGTESDRLEGQEPVGAEMPLPNDEWRLPQAKRKGPFN